MPPDLSSRTAEVRSFAGHRDLAVLLRELRPQLREGEWVFVTAARLPSGAEPLAFFAEDEGPSWVVRREQADADGLGCRGGRFERDDHHSRTRWLQARRYRRR